METEGSTETSVYISGKRKLRRDYEHSIGPHWALTKYQISQHLMLPSVTSHSYYVTGETG